MAGNGIRAASSDAGGVTRFYHSDEMLLSKVMPSGSQIDYVWRAPGQLIATIDAGGIVKYVLGDHLSPRVVTDAGGMPVSSVGHYPFGESWYGFQEWLFGTYLPAATGLDYAVARFYDPQTGRFSSADPDTGDGHNPQSHNRYTYVLGDPISSWDLRGRSRDMNPFMQVCISYGWGAGRCYDLLLVDSINVTGETPWIFTNIDDVWNWQNTGNPIVLIRGPKGTVVVTPQVLLKLYCLWRVNADEGHAIDESALMMFETGSGYGFDASNWTYGHDRQKKTAWGSYDGVHISDGVAAMHTHPNYTGAYPSLGDGGDSAYATKLGIPYFLVSRVGLTVALPGGGTLLLANDKWLKANKKGGTKCD